MRHIPNHNLVSAYPPVPNKGANQMGMYTKFGFQATIYSLHLETVEEGLKNQKLTSGHYHVEIDWTKNSLGWELKLLFPNEIKNDEKQIEDFMKWITPFVAPRDKPIAAQWYETWAIPKLYYVTDKVIKK